MGSVVLGAGLAPGPARAAQMCTPAFQEDFETGTLGRWEGTYGSRPTVTTRDAISGTYSLSSDLSTINAVKKTLALPTQRLVRLSFTSDVSMGALANPTAVGAFESADGTREQAWVNLGRRSGNGDGVQVWAFNGSQGHEESPLFALPGRSRIQLEWERATSPTTGVVRLFVDGTLVWTSRATGDQASAVGALYLGNMSNNASGRLFADDVLVETCVDVLAPPDAATPDTAPDGPADAGAVDAAGLDAPAPDARLPDTAGPLDAATAADATAQADAVPADAVTSDSRTQPDLSLAVDAASDEAPRSGLALDLRVGCACAFDGRRAPGQGPLPIALLFGLLALRAHRQRRTRSQTTRGPAPGALRDIARLVKGPLDRSSWCERARRGLLRRLQRTATVVHTSVRQLIVHGLEKAPELNRSVMVHDVRPFQTATGSCRAACSSGSARV